MGLPPLTFTGVSDFSNDLQAVLDRAVQIAQIPVKQLQNKDADVLSRKALLSSISSATVGLADSLASLGTIAANRSLSATSSDPAKVAVTNTGATLPGNFVINSITSAATFASERSTAGYADSAATPVSSNGSMRLVVGGQQYDFTLTTNTLIGLRDKINSLATGVTASILTTANGNYLSIGANATGAKAISLIDNPSGSATNLLTATNPGSNAVFQLNGITIDQPGNVVNSTVPGLSFTIRAASATPVTLTLATDRSKLQSGLEDFVKNLNALRGEVNKQIGPAAGALSGSSVITQLSSKLREIGAYQIGSGSVKNLSDLGITFNSSGLAEFNASKFTSLSDIDIDNAFIFLGTALTGFGGLAKDLRQIGDPVSGLIKSEQDGLDRTDKQLQAQIAAMNERILIMRNGLAVKLHAADAVLATLAQQQKQLTASLQGLNVTLYGKKND